MVYGTHYEKLSDERANEIDIIKKNAVYPLLGMAQDKKNQRLKHKKKEKATKRGIDWIWYSCVSSP